MSKDRDFVASQHIGVLVTLFKEQHEQVQSYAQLLKQAAGLPSKPYAIRLGRDDTIDADKYCNQLDQLKAASSGETARIGVVFHHDNARPHVALSVRQKLLSKSHRKTTLPVEHQTKDCEPSEIVRQGGGEIVAGEVKIVKANNRAANVSWTVVANATRGKEPCNYRRTKSHNSPVEPFPSVSRLKNRRTDQTPKRKTKTTKRRKKEAQTMITVSTKTISIGTGLKNCNIKSDITLQKENVLYSGTSRTNLPLENPNDEARHWRTMLDVAFSPGLFRTSLNVVCNKTAIISGGQLERSLTKNSLEYVTTIFYLTTSDVPTTYNREPVTFLERRERLRFFESLKICQAHLNLAELSNVCFTFIAGYSNPPLAYQKRKKHSLEPQKVEEVSCTFHAPDERMENTSADASSTLLLEKERPRECGDAEKRDAERMASQRLMQPDREMEHRGFFCLKWTTEGLVRLLLKRVSQRIMTVLRNRAPRNCFLEEAENSLKIIYY
ncbi:hypothetical protein WN51_14505 [Melipona quadrifasciata]|uniref:Histone-lysine N-methyltransferase SETMAR n=1 Tax=Melipona quadrifasciata TaxID=166423 RepID=A0A0M9A0R1_9HYME|nr:hypothetical protein WN51_14505 [Melipona quadrifasciata]